MTREQKAANRKKANKISAYLTDPLRDFVSEEIKKPGQNRSKLVQEGLTLVKAKRDAQRT